jgi:hypothetical protein
MQHVTTKGKRIGFPLCPRPEDELKGVWKADIMSGPYQRPTTGALSRKTLEAP